MAVSEDHGAVRPEPPTTYYDDVVRLPGLGEAPNRCRKMKPVGFCDHGHVVLGRSSCGTRYCPDHWRDWIQGAVESAVARLAAYRQAVEGAEKRLVHAVASPPQDRRYSADRLWATRSEAYDAFEAAGIRGGVTVTHPYRTNDRGEGLFRTAVEAGAVEEDTGRWRFLREASDGWEDLSRYVEASPHYHALAPSKDVDGGAAPEGWVVKRIRTMSNFHLYDTESYRDMAATMYYVLTHGGVQTGRQLTTYFGEVHPAAFDPEEELTAAEWDRIQEEAARAVGEAPEESEEGFGTAGPDECPHDGCEAAVCDLLYLEERLADEEWVASVRAFEDGGQRLAELRGALAYWKDLTDRPPPSAHSSPEQYRRWLKARGQVRAPGSSSRSSSRQVALGTAVMSS